MRCYVRNLLIYRAHILLQQVLSLMCGSWRITNLKEGYIAYPNRKKSGKISESSSIFVRLLGHIDVAMQGDMLMTVCVSISKSHT